VGGIGAGECCQGGSIDNLVSHHRRALWPGAPAPPGARDRRSDSDPNVARLTGSVELLPLGGATGEHGATGPDPLVGRMGCYPGNPAGAEAAVVRGGNVDRRNLGRLAGPMGLLDRRAVTVSYRFPAVAEPAGCQRTITPFTASQPRVLPLHRFLTAYPGELSRLELQLHDCGRSWQAIDVAQVLRLRCGGFGERATPGENGGAHRGSPKRSSQGATTLSDLGVTRDQSSQRQQLAVDTWARY